MRDATKERQCVSKLTSMRNQVCKGKEKNRKPVKFGEILKNGVHFLAIKVILLVTH